MTKRTAGAPLQLFDHTSGVKTFVSPMLTDPTSLATAENVELFSRLGAVRKQHGDSILGGTIDAAHTIQGVFPFNTPDGTERIFGASNGVIYQNVGGTWTSKKTGLSTSAKMFSAVMYDHLYVVDGVNAINYTTDGTTWSSVSAEKPSLTAVFKNRLYGANYPTGKNRFAWSDVGDGTSLNGDPAHATPDNYSDDIPDPIVGILSTSNYLYLWTDKEFYRYDETYLIRIAPVGAAGQRAIAAGDSEIVWANADGLWLSNGGVPQHIQRPVERYYDLVGTSQIANVAVGFFDNTFYVALGTATGTIDGETLSNIVLVYQTQIKAWTMYTGLPVACWATWSQSGISQLYYGTNATPGLVLQLLRPVDSAGGHYSTGSQVAFTAGFAYQPIVPANPHQDVQGKSLYCYAIADGKVTFQIQVALDWQDTFTTLAEWTLQGSGDMETFFFSLPASMRGRSVQFRVTDGGALVADWQWIGMEFYYSQNPGMRD